MKRMSRRNGAYGLTVFAVAILAGIAHARIAERRAEQAKIKPGGSEALGLDRYGGIEFPIVKPPGYFRVMKLGHRWILVTPDGHPFWYKGVQYADFKNLESTVIANKYGGSNTLWATQRNRRMLSWGFNVIGMDSSEIGLPVGVYGSTTPNAVQIPFLLTLNASLRGATNPHGVMVKIPEYLKQVVAGVPTATYNGWRGKLPDPYEPNFALAFQHEIGYWQNTIVTGGFADKSWIVGISMDDADATWAFKGPGNGPLAKYPHIGFLVACTKFIYTAAENPDRQNWIDSKFYAKYAWIDYLKVKYSTIAGLNTAWGTSGFYTSFDDAGGFGTGTGVIDEDGRHTAWIGSDPYLLSHTTPGLKADLDAFSYQFAKKYAQVVTDAIRAVDTNHLIFGPDAINNYGTRARNEILQGLTDGGVDVFVLNYDPSFGPMAGSMADNNLTYDLTGKPAILWYTLTAQADSYMSAYPPQYAIPNFSTQASRANHYATVDIPNFLNAQGANGDYYILGFDWWTLIDMPNEQANLGLITPKDNAYDGKEAVSARGKDRFGYPTGGEARNYGDFISAVRQANLDVLKRLREEIGR